MLDRKISKSGAQTYPSPWHQKLCYGELLGPSMHILHFIVLPAFER